MPAPTYYSEGTRPRLSDTRRVLLVKWLGAIQDNLGAFALGSNNPRKTDPRRVLLGKIDAALSGAPFPG